MFSQCWMSREHCGGRHLVEAIDINVETEFLYDYPICGHLIFFSICLSSIVARSQTEITDCLSLRDITSEFAHARRRYHEMSSLGFTTTRRRRPWIVCFHQLWKSLLLASCEDVPASVGAQKRSFPSSTKTRCKSGIYPSLSGLRYTREASW